jgi:hemerythrin-like domain-containing protein
MYAQSVVRCQNRCGRPATLRGMCSQPILWPAMVQIIDQLSRDHRNMRVLLEIIEEEMNAYRNGRVPDFDLLRMITEYILDYPDLVHHPKEDLVFERIAIRDPEAKAVIGHLVQDHKELSELTRRFAAAISSAARDMELSRDWLDSLAREYLFAARTHMQTEETHFLPRAAAILTDQDWIQVEQNVTHIEDPMFGKKVAEAYLFLYERIVKLR